MTNNDDSSGRIIQQSDGWAAAVASMPRSEQDRTRATIRLTEAIGEPWLFPPIVDGNVTAFVFARHDVAVDGDMGIRVGIPIGIITVEGTDVTIDWRWIDVPATDAADVAYSFDLNPWSDALMRRPGYEQAALVESLFDMDAHGRAELLAFALPDWLKPFYGEVGETVGEAPPVPRRLRTDEIASTHMPVVGPVEHGVFTSSDRIATRIDALGLEPTSLSVLGDLPEASGDDTVGVDIDVDLTVMTSPDWVIRFEGLAEQGAINLSVSVSETPEGTAWVGLSESDGSAILSPFVDPLALARTAVAMLGPGLPEQPAYSVKAPPQELALVAAASDLYRQEGAEAVFASWDALEQALAAHAPNTVVTALRPVVGTQSPDDLRTLRPAYLVGIYEDSLAASGPAASLVKALSAIRTYVTITIDTAGSSGPPPTMTFVRTDYGQFAVRGNTNSDGTVDIIAVGNADAESVLLSFLGVSSTIDG